MHYNIIYLKDKIMEIRTNKSYMIFYSFISLLIWDFKEKNKMPNILYQKKNSQKGFKRSNFSECSKCMVVNMMHEIFKTTLLLM